MCSNATVVSHFYRIVSRPHFFRDDDLAKVLQFGFPGNPGSTAIGSFQTMRFHALAQAAVNCALGNAIKIRKLFDDSACLGASLWKKADFIAQIDQAVFRDLLVRHNAVPRIPVFYFMPDNLQIGVMTILRAII